MNNKGFSFLAISFILSILLAIFGIGWFVYANNSQNQANKTPQVAGAQETTSEQDINKEFEPLKNIKTYQNKALGLSFEYPSEWSITDPSQSQKQLGAIVLLNSPSNVSTGNTKPDLVVSHWNNINTEPALGGSWDGQRQYSDLADYITDPNYGYKKSLDTKNYTGQELHIVTIGGHSESYGVMLESDNGIFEFNFNNIINAKHTTQQSNHIVTSIKTK
jgi:hypothetical protein